MQAIKPRVLARRRRFYSNSLFLGDLASELAGLLMSFWTTLTPESRSFAFTRPPHVSVSWIYYSRYMEVQRLTNTSASSVIASLKSIFSRHGVLSVLVIDNGPQYNRKEMRKFARDYCIKHITSSPYHPQSNGLAERTVKTVTRIHLILTKQCWATPLPAELLMGRKIRTDSYPSIAENVHPWLNVHETLQRGRQAVEAEADVRFR